MRDPETGWVEADVTINGASLSFAEVMSLRVAVSSFRLTLNDDSFRSGLGEDLARNYDHHLSRVEALLIAQR
jgi:hypothetical protein